MTNNVIGKSWQFRLAFVMILSLIIASCTVATQSVEQTQPTIKEQTQQPSNELVNLTLTMWSSDKAQLALFNEIAAEYKKDHPNVSVNYLSIPFADYVSKITVQLAGNNPPDAGWVVDSTAPTFIGAGVLRDLRPTLENYPDYDLADFASGPMSLWVKGKAIYGVPFSTSPYIIFYNIDLFKKAGIDTPDILLEQGKWTWDSLRAAAKAISNTNKSPIHGFEGYNGSEFYGVRLWNTMGSMMNAFGGQAWNDEGTQCTINSPEAVAAFQFIHDMIFVDGGALRPGEAADFFSGNAGMTLGLIGRTSALKDVKFKWDIAPLPSGPAGYKPTTGQAAFVVFNASKHADVAADFIAFMTNKVNVAKIGKYFPPARSSVIHSQEFLASNPLVSPKSMELAIAKSIEAGTVEVIHPEFPKIDLAARAVIDKMWVAGADVKTVLDETCKAIQPFMLK